MGPNARQSVSTAAEIVPIKDIEPLMPDIEIVNGDLDRPYQVIGHTTATVRGVAVLSRSPTTEEVDSKLRENALKLGANAVIHVTYIGAFAWKELTASGVAVTASPAT
jgi:hypothetical protein